MAALSHSKKAKKKSGSDAAVAAAASQELQRAVLPDPVMLEVFSNALLSIAEEMGALLIRTAYSTNIKERHDASTAIFDAKGLLITQAEHIPMHLGAMLSAVKHILKRYPVDDIRPGDAFLALEVGRHISPGQARRRADHNRARWRQTRPRPRQPGASRSSLHDHHSLGGHPVLGPW